MVYYDIRLSAEQVRALRSAIGLGAFHSYAEQVRQMLKRPVDTGHELNLQSRLEALDAAAEIILTARPTNLERS